MNFTRRTPSDAEVSAKFSTGAKATSPSPRVAARGEGWGAQRRGGRGERGSETAVALVITLLMLSVITFLAVAFLAMTARNRSAVTAELDVDTARSMSDAAFSRAEAGIIAQMMATGDVLSYGYLTSHNYVSPNAFAGTSNLTDVNYDSLYTNAGMYGGLGTPAWNIACASNIANLFYDPRAPVFIVTNNNLLLPQTDFRFWVDINRNGRFETNGPANNPVATIDSTGNPTGAISVVHGEPEWVGELKYPEYAHSANNPFIGRYAFLVQPIGKTLDLNFIHNNSRFAGTGTLNPKFDGYIRNEGVGSWELNLAAVLNDLSPYFQTNQMYGDVPWGYYDYTKYTNGLINQDAMWFLAYRYGTNFTFPRGLSNYFGTPLPLGLNLYAVDNYGLYPRQEAPLDYNQYSSQVPIVLTYWPGNNNSNQFYDIQDMFDQNKVGPNFAINLSTAVGKIDTANRYAFQTMLDCIGTGSTPEYGVYVYSNISMIGASQMPPTGVPPPSVLRTKVNLDYDNTAQIQAGPYSPYGAYTPMPTNLVPWTPLGFFTNAAESLLRSQVFVYTNYTTNAAGNAFVQSNFLYMTFGLTNIPVYNYLNPGIVYNEQVHRMLQLAANIYADAYPTYKGQNQNQVQQPPIFRPQFQIIPGGGSNRFVNITNFVLVTNDAYTQMNRSFYDLTDANAAKVNNPNFWGIPWVVGVVKNVPEFNQFTYYNQIYHGRKVLFVRKSVSPPNGPADTNDPPYYTNQFYEFSITNVCGMDVWNPYISPFYGSSGSAVAMASNLITVTLTNNYNWGTNIYVTNVVYPKDLLGGGSWPGWANPRISQTSKGQIQTFMLSTNPVLPLGYYSESNHNFVVYGPGNNNTFLQGDTNQHNSFPTHYWTVNVTNHVYCALFDGKAGSGNLLDFVNLGPFGSSFPITQWLTTNNNQYLVTPATDLPGSPPSAGLLNQIAASLQGGVNQAYYYSLRPQKNVPNDSASVGSFGPPDPNQTTGVNAAYGPSVVKGDSNAWMACDPLVHYTVGDLAYPLASPIVDGSLTVPIPLGTGMVTKRYTPWPGWTGAVTSANMLFMDPLVTNADAWQFPTNIFPSVGWLGRVHRGTPWQTIYLKSDNPKGAAAEQYPVQDWAGWVSSPLTYPTNDWSLIDLFTAVPNDNAARGLLSVNQTNDAAWAAVYAGIIALTNAGAGTVIGPANDAFNFYGLGIDGPQGLNATRATNANGLFHHVGDVLQSSILTVNSPYLANLPASELTDEMVERIPQQTLGLLKVGFPQFVIYSWGQSLRPKNIYTGGALAGLCTNYEITGEYLTRTVCHIVSDPAAAAPKIIVDNFNIEPGN